MAPLIQDGVYDELYFTADKPRPAKAFDRKGQVMAALGGIAAVLMSEGKSHHEDPAARKRAR